MNHGKAIVYRAYYFLCSIGFLLLCANATAQSSAGRITVHIDETKTYQTIENFGASDAWSCQFVGSWPEEKKNAIADWLFSRDTFANGSPKGIGLSLWRYNLGSGSAEQNDSSGIRDEWRRAALTTGNSQKVQAQNWFLQAAKKRGVSRFLGFFNSPPVQFTKNKKAFADKGMCNIDSNQYQAFADYTIAAINHVKNTTGITFNYISPVNEPQWDWSDGGQEGCPYDNNEIGSLIKVFNRQFHKDGLSTKLLISESGHLKYMLPANDKTEKDNQVHDFFNAASPAYVGNLPNVAPAIASHSYFSTSPFADAISLRTQVKNSISHIANLSLWQSEYCILGDNAGEINGSKKDLGMNAALYLAKVIYEDLATANASAWQWWTALSAYDYKDGLIYVDKNKSDGNFSDSKMLWALGNYSRFIMPGMQRIDVTAPAVKNVYVSAYKDRKTKQTVCVLVNESNSENILDFDKAGAKTIHAKVVLYITDADTNLAKKSMDGNQVVLPAKSIVTIVMN